MQIPAIEVHDVTVSYNRKPALWGIDFAVPEGKLVGIIGPNGAGKSTMIKAMMDLNKLDSGYIKLFGKDIHDVRDRVAYVPQRGSVDWDFPASVLNRIYINKKLQRQREILVRKEVLMMERDRISADLHDDLGSTLSSISIYSEAIKNKSRQPFRI